MAATPEGRLTNNQIVRLARAISSQNMESIALGYMGIEKETIKNIKGSRREDMEGFNRDLIEEWENINCGSNQCQTLASILFRAAEECGYADPSKVEAILGVSRTSVSSGTNTGQTHNDSTLTDEELESLAEDLKPHTEEAMKIEMAPWLKEHITDVDMDKLYTELTVEHVSNEPQGEKRTKVNDYRELFEENFGSRPQAGDCVPPSKKICIRKRKSIRILVKGKPGIGKTTLAKKMTSDWARGLFTKFSIVFFVFLKLVKPGDVIDSVIIKQNPWIEGLGLTNHRIRNVLEIFGDKCLLILDGLDEHALGNNEDVFKIIKDRKYLKCNVLITSRPHTEADIRHHFRLVAEVEGFTRAHAREFVSKILSDETQIKAVVSFNPHDDLSACGDTGYESEDQNESEYYDGREWRNSDDENDDDDNDNQDRTQMYNCPILLSILCLLVKHEQLVMKKKNSCFGEVYARMIRCLYFKYLKRKGIKFQMSQFIEVVKKVGKLAWQTLVSGNPLIQRSDVIRDVGEDAFEYGFLIGHEDFRLIGDETADIYVTFAHRTIQEFFAAIHFVLTFSGSESMALFLTNPLFFQFCTYLMYSSEILLGSMCLARARQRLQNLVLNKVNFAQLEFKEIAYSYPALDIVSAYNRNDSSSLKFFAGLLSKCTRVKDLVLNSRVANWAIESMSIECLSSVSLSGIFFCAPHCSDTNSFRLAIAQGHLTDKTYNVIAKVVDRLSQTNRNVLIFVPSREFDYEIVDLSRLLRVGVTQLHIGRSLIVSDQLEISLVECPSLTHLSLCDVSFDSEETLVKAVMEHKIPNLTYLCVTGYQYLLDILLRAVAQNTRIKDVKLLEFGLTGKIMRSLCRSLSQKLVSLQLSFPNDSMGVRELVGLFQWPWRRLSLKCESSQDEAGVDNCRNVIENLAESLMPSISTLCLINSIICTSYLQSLIQNVVLKQMSHLDISQSSGITGNLNILLCHDLPSLETLILNGCELIADDVRSLAEANAKGRLQRLKHLDVSRNDDLDLRDLFEFNCRWGHLLRLNAALLYEKSDFKWLSDKVSSGCLGSLEELRLWAPHHRHDLFTTHLSLQHLHRMEVALMNHNCDGGYIFGSLAESYKRGDLPSLKTVLLVTDYPEYSLMELGLSEAMDALRQCDVSLYIGRIEDEPFFP